MGLVEGTIALFLLTAPLSPSGFTLDVAPAPLAALTDSSLAAGVPVGPASRPDSLPGVRVPLPWRTADSTGEKRWFYQGLPYGSESLIHPLRLITNGGLGILQFDNRSNRLASVHFQTGWSNMWDNLAHPVRAIEVEGWWDFFQREVIPISFNKNNAQYWPNYTLHLIGGGMSYTMMSEWFSHNGYPGHRWWAGGTIAAYHLLNEVVENEIYVGPSTDAIADLYIFDPLSVVLFSHEPVNEFFSRRLHMRDWSYQPAFDLEHGTIENQGQNFSIKVPIPRTKRWSFFYYFGTHGEGGLSYAKPNGSAFSVAGGFRAKELVNVTTETKTVELAPSFGFFYDRNGSLMFSALWANTSRYKMRINAYPGLLRIGPVTPGLFVNLNRGEAETVIGLDLRLADFIPWGIATRP